MWKRLRYFGFKQDAGAAALEFAIIAPLFLIMLFSLIAFGIYLGAAHSVQQLTASAARASIAGIDEEERSSLSQGYVNGNAERFPLIDPAFVFVETSQVTGDMSAYSVTVRYDANRLPIWNLYAPVMSLPETIEMTSIIRDGEI